MIRLTHSPWASAACSLLAAVAALSVLGCEDKQEKLYEPSDPRPAHPVDEPVAGEFVSFQVAPESRISFELRSREVTTKGSIGVVRGEFRVNLADLEHSSGHVEVDVAALRMQSFESEDDNKLQAERARNWLNVGSSRAEAAREQSRWARFEFQALDAARPPSAFEAKLIKKLLPPAPSTSAEDAPVAAPAAAPVPAKAAKPQFEHHGPNGDIELYDEEASPPDAGDAAAPRVLAGEIRRSTLSVNGQLSLNSFRKATSASLEALFEFKGPAAVGSAPERIVLKSTKPLSINFADHDIKPRNAHGVLEASQSDLLKRAGSRVKVTLELVLVPKR
ncbi:MAG: hypothetical protein R3B07_22570 [Polyangiaceae bacterium]